MKKISIVFHSVSGNNYLLAKKFYDTLTNKGIQTNLFKVYDDDFEELSNTFDFAKRYKKEIESVETYDFKELLESDALIIGSPTYFGNVSAEMKVFMDKFVDYWENADFYGKKIFAFASAGNAEGGGHLCLNAINTFAQHNGMITIPVPSNLIKGQDFSAYGFVHYAGALADIEPSDVLYSAIEKMCEIIIDQIQCKT